jgi:adenosine 3'-phospho 5'-phosphosulfate transporter B3
MNIAAYKLSYSTEILFRSCKLIPVLIGNMLFKKKVPSFIQVISVLLLVFGLIGVSIADVKVANQFNFIGVMCAVISLFFDAFSANMEDKLLNDYNVTRDELVIKVYGLGSLFILVLSIINGEFATGWNRTIHHLDCIPDMIGFVFFGVMGVQFQYLAMSVWGVVRTVMVTSIRKGLSYILSNVLFKNKKFTIIHFISVCSLAVGLGLNIYEKSLKEDKNTKKEEKENCEEEEIETQILTNEIFQDVLDKSSV